MKKLITILMLCILIPFFSTDLLSQAQEHIEKYSKIKITIRDKSDLKELQKAGLSLEGMKLEERSVELIVSEREIKKLDDLGFSYEVLINDMTKYYRERSRRTDSEMKILEGKMKKKYSNGGFGFGSMGGYYTFDEVVAELDTMRLLYPNLITEKDSIGSTIEGRTIWAVKISDNPDITEGEPEVFYNALNHAREPEGMMSVIYFMYHLLENYGTDPEITYLVDNRGLYFVPVINPDGYVYNETRSPNGGGMWRKNMNINDGGCKGVDNNRNYGYMWGYNNIGSSPDPCAEDYRGTEAFSEFENQAIRNYCNNHNFIICNNYHAYWDVLFTPWAYNLTQTPDSTTYNYTITLATQFNGYLNGHFNIPGNYELNGDVTDWMYGEQTSKPKIFAYLTEVGNNNDGFWPPPERIFPIAEDNVYLNKVLAWGPGVIENPPHIFEGNVYPGYCVPLEDSITIIAIESNPENINSIVTAQIIDNDENVIDEFQLSDIGNNNFSGSWYVTPPEEQFYKVLLKQSGIEIPSNFYYQEKLKFTTAGPVVLDSLKVTMLDSNTIVLHEIYISNKSESITINGIQVKPKSIDSCATTGSGIRILGNLNPGETRKLFGTYSFNIYSCNSDSVSLAMEIYSDGILYWESRFKLGIPIVGIEDIAEGLPTEYLLSQNYPNPFNPTTTIKYQIPDLPAGRQGLSYVTIKIFDVLGSEIAKLVNEEKPIGTYEITWYASALPSGIYFYRIQVYAPGRAGEFIETKKMILLK